jgi:type VI secretion system secreted protein Hcp
MRAQEFFLKIDGIDGECHDAAHKNEIELERWTWGATNTGDSTFRGSIGVGKVNMQDFHANMRVNKSSPKLMEACASGQHFKEAVLTCRKAGNNQQAYLKVKMSDLIVSSFQTGGTVADEVPLDEISLNFSKIVFEYKEQKADGTLGGTVKSGWDVKANKSV